MFRLIYPAARLLRTTKLLPNLRNHAAVITPSSNRTLTTTTAPLLRSCESLRLGLLSNHNITQIAYNIGQVRTVTKFSRKKGTRKSVKTVLVKFFRLNWGGWIRTRCGRNKKLWKKKENTKRRLRQHVLCNSTQSYLLDKMVTKFWKKPKYYVDDPYEPYHSREEFWITRKKPLIRS